MSGPHIVHRIREQAKVAGLALKSTHTYTLEAKWGDQYLVQARHYPRHQTHLKAAAQGGVRTEATLLATEIMAARTITTDGETQCFKSKRSLPEHHLYWWRVR